jgi:hypothetical protein
MGWKIVAKGEGQGLELCKRGGLSNLNFVVI